MVQFYLCNLDTIHVTMATSTRLPPTALPKITQNRYPKSEGDSSSSVYIQKKVCVLKIWNFNNMDVQKS